MGLFIALYRQNKADYLTFVPVAFTVFSDSFRPLNIDILY